MSCPVAIEKPARTSSRPKTNAIRTESHSASRIDDHTVSILLVPLPLLESEGFLDVDMQTLSRMTGKDFSGPTPEIRAPTPLRLPPDPRSAAAQDNDDTLVKVRKQSATPALGEGEEEVVGEVNEDGEAAVDVAI